MIQRWKQGIRHIAFITVLLGASFVPESPGAAQLLPDRSLGGENSIVTTGNNQQGQTVNLIEGGARRGSNLFHSFQDFNVGNFQRVYFANPAGVETILSRVTGTHTSNILGTLGVLGNADLFLINPNGIFFGPNATLDIRGSFVASTASSIHFANGTEFSAISPSTSLLTVSVPIGLQFNGGEGNIVVQAGQALQSNNPFMEEGDAGQRLRNAQVFPSRGSGTSFDAISGNLSDAEDIDLYQLSLTAGQPFTASTVGGTAINTELFLFDSNGLGILASNESTGFQSTLPFYQPFIPERSGIYYLGVSSYDINPRNSQGDIFDGEGNLAATGRSSPLRDWDGIPGPSIRPNRGAYTITLNSRGEGLHVRTGRTLALVGGNVRLEGGTIQAPGGRVELAGVTGRGIVRLDHIGQGIRLRVPDRLARANIALTGNSLVNVSAGRRGSIAIHTQNLDVRTSSLLAGIAPGLSFHGSRAGDIAINATGAITLDASSMINDVAFRSSGDAGRITISAGALTLSNGSILYARTLGDGNAGNIEIQAHDTASFDYSLAVSAVAPTGTGQGGDVRITAGSVSVTNIAQLVALTQGRGDAGNVIINARDTVHFDGRDPNLFIASSAFSSVGDSSVAGSLANGRGGDIRITANSLRLTNGARLVTATYGRGNAGNVVIQTQDRSSFDSGSGVLSGVYFTGTGNGGRITINSGSLLLNNGADFVVGSLGAGEAGSLFVEADEIRLSNRGAISANTVGGGGNIDLRSPLLLLSRNSTITTNAMGTATGGNIDIEASFIVAPPNENSDIIANGFAGSGGQITLTAQGIFGFDFRSREELQRLLNTTNPIELDPQRLSTNDVTAFSQANPTIDTGTVTVQTPDINPTQGLTALPTDPTDPSQLIATTCAADEGNSFAMTGRGGLPDDPRQPLMGQVIWQDERRGREDLRDGELEELGSRRTAPIIEAQGWMVDPTGAVILVAQHSPISSLTSLGQLPCSSSGMSSRTTSG